MKMKQYCDYLLRVAEAMAKDASRLLPDSQLGLDRDISRLSSLVKTRGLPVFTIDLPALGKWLDQSLAKGAYTRPDLPLRRHFKNGSPVPRLFQGLMLRIFDEAGVLRENPCIDSIAILRQFYLFGKKLTVKCKERYLYESISEFYKIEDDLPTADCSWEDITPISEQKEQQGRHVDDSLMSYNVNGLSELERKLRLIDESFTVQGLLSLCQKEFDNVLGQFKTNAPISNWDGTEFLPKHGPGSVSDLKKGLHKYNFLHWPAQLELFFPQADFAFANYNYWMEDPLDTTWDTGSGKFGHSRLISVPKTQKGPRLIAAEPVAHQWCQQAVRGYIEKAIRSTEYAKVINFRDQTQNQEYALAASRTGLAWTVDLSAASDRLSTRLVERVFRNFPFLLDSLHACRTKYIQQHLDKKGPLSIPLKKFSTMGSACTFPVQTLVFACLAVACSVYAGKQPRHKGITKILKSTSVYGDDIIVPEYAGQVLELVLEYLDFKVNQDKTFRNGKFRESCGLDAYDGVEVTPAYIRTFPTTQRPKSVVSTVDTSNNFFLKGYWECAEEIRAQNGWYNSIPVVSADSGTFGYVSFSGYKFTTKTRWNTEYQRREFRTLRIIEESESRATQEAATLLQYFIERPDKDLDVLDDIPARSLGVLLRSRLKLRPGWENIDRLTAV
jgi:hypothetical protein